MTEVEFLRIRNEALSRHEINFTWSMYLKTFVKCLLDRDEKYKIEKMSKIFRKA